MIYLDTNVFLSAVEPIDRFHQDAQTLLKLVETGKISATTSTETFQEIVHVAKKQKRLQNGVELCHILLQLIPLPLIIDKAAIEKLLQQINNIHSLETRDCIHLSVCLVNSIPSLVTEDKNMRNTSISRLTFFSIKNALKLTG